MTVPLIPCEKKSLFEEKKYYCFPPKWYILNRVQMAWATKQSIIGYDLFEIDIRNLMKLFYKLSVLLNKSC